MCGSIIALIISLMMIAFTIYKGSCVKQYRICCRKSEFYNLLKDIPDDCIIEVWLTKRE